MSLECVLNVEFLFMTCLVGIGSSYLSQFGAFFVVTNDRVFVVRALLRNGRPPCIVMSRTLDHGRVGSGLLGFVGER